MRIFMPKLKIVGVVLLILALANYLFITQSQILEGNSYEHVNPLMLTAVQQTNKRILKKIAIDSLLFLPPKQWVLRTVSYTELHF